jgi:hypothetical protein
MIPAKGATASINLPWDEALYQQLKEDNDRELEEYKKEEEDAAENAGDTEVNAARGKRAEFWARVGDKVRYSIKPFRYGMLKDACNRRKRLRRTRICSRRPAFWVPRSISY